MLVREPIAADGPALGLVHVRAWQEGYKGGLMPDDYLAGLSVEDRAAMWTQLLSTPPRPGGGRLLVEDENGRVAGHLTYGPTSDKTLPDSGEVYSLNVDPDLWGQGYGSTLLEAGVDRLTRAGFGSAILWVHRDNQRARRFYEARGWSADGAEQDVTIQGVTVPEVRYVLDRLSTGAVPP